MEFRRRFCCPANQLNFIRFPICFFFFFLVSMMKISQIYICGKGKFTQTQMRTRLRLFILLFYKYVILFSVIAAAIETELLIGGHNVHMKFACRRRNDCCKFDICVLMKPLFLFGQSLISRAIRKSWFHHSIAFKMRFLVFNCIRDAGRTESQLMSRQ